MNNEVTVNNKTYDVDINQSVTKQKSNDDSIELLLDIIINEYKGERERNSALESKAGITIGLLFTALAIIFNIIPFSEIMSYYNKTQRTDILSVCFALLILVVIVLLISFRFLLLVIIPRSFYRVNIESVKNKKLYEQNILKTKKDLIDHYYEIICKNIEIGDKKAKYLNRGITLGMISIFLCSIISVIISLIVG